MIGIQKDLNIGDRWKILDTNDLIQLNLYVSNNQMSLKVIMKRRRLNVGCSLVDLIIDWPKRLDFGLSFFKFWIKSSVSMNTFENNFMIGLKFESKKDHVSVYK